MLSRLVVCAALVALVTGKACSPGPADVMFILSSNVTLTRAEFNQKLGVIEDFVKGVNIGPNGVRVGVVAEYDYADLEFHMNDHMNKTELLTALPYIYFGQRGATQGVGIQYINQNGMNNLLGGRAGVPDVIIYLTTSNPSQATMAHLESLELQKTGATVIGLGVGDFPKNDLLSVASGCHYIDQINDFSTAASLVESAINLTCDAVNGVPANDCCTLPTCCPLSLDVIYLLDASSTSGQTKADFTKQLDWAKGVTSSLQIASNGTRVGAVTYADHVHPQFGLDYHPQKDDLMLGLTFLPMQYGGRNATQALQWIADNGFQPARPGVQKVVVVTSVGPQDDPAAAKAQVARLKAMGVDVVSVGIGAQFSEVVGMASSAGKVRLYDNYDDLVADTTTGKIMTCGGEVAPPTPKPTTPAPTTAAPTTAAPTPAPSKCDSKICQNGGSCVESDDHEATCICLPGYSGDDCELRCVSQPSDVVFVLDSSRSEGLPNYRKQVQFVSDVILSLQLGQNDVQVGLMAFSNRNHLVFNLNRYHTAAPMLTAVNNTRYYAGFTHTAEALQYVREDMLSASAGRRLNAQPVVIVLTDGQSSDEASTLSQAKLLKDTGALVIAIGIGQQTNDAELTAIASNDAHKFTLDNFGLLTTIQQEIVRTTCNTNDPVGDHSTSAPATTNAPVTAAPTTQAPNSGICTNNPCLNSGTCIPDGDSFSCSCAPGFTGRFCLQTVTISDSTTPAPTTSAPTTQAPTTQAPTTQAPTTQAPTTQAPTTQAPTTQAPTTPGTTADIFGGNILSTLGLEGCNKADILFLVEHMRRDDGFDVDHQSDMIRNLVHGWTIDDNHVRVGVTIYEQLINEYIKFNDFSGNKMGLTDRLEEMYAHLGTAATNNLNYVLDFSRTNSFQHARPGANKVAVAIVHYTSAVARARYEAAAQALKDSGVTLYVLAVDPNDTDRVLLQSKADHYFEFGDWSELENSVPNRTFQPNCP